MIEFIDKTSEQDGTLLNRKNMMAMQGFVSNVTSATEQGIVIENTESGETITMTPLNAQGKCFTTIQGKKTLTKTSSFTPTGIAKELS